MSNTIYKQALSQGYTGISLTTGALKATLVGTSTVSHSAATQQYAEALAALVNELTQPKTIIKDESGWTIN